MGLVWSHPVTIQREGSGTMSEETGNEVSNTGTEGGEIVVRPHVRFAEYLQQRAEVESENIAEELSADQMDKILSATNAEELYKAMEFAGLIALRDIEAGTEIQVNGYRVAPGTRSEFMNSLGVWAVMNCQDMADGIQFIADTGVERVIGFLRMWEVLEGFPAQVRISKVQTGKGNEMITLLPVRHRAVPGTVE